MELKDYSTEELKSELKRRSDLAKAEKGQSEKMQNVQTLGKRTYWGEDLSSEKYEWIKRVNCSKCCIFFKTKNGKNYRSNSPY